MYIIRRESGSSGASALREVMSVVSGGRVVLSNRQRFRRENTVINWGSSAPINTGGRVLNDPEAVAVASDKLATFRALENIREYIPDYWTEASEVVRDGIILERHKLRSCEGGGIRVVRRNEQLTKAPLYVKYIPKLREYRVHVVGDTTVVQQKRRVNGSQQTDNQRLIRSLNNWWAFCITLTHPNEAEPVKEVAVKAVKELSLDFGAVDMVVCRSTGKPYVLEVNTKPGLNSPTVLEAYASSFLSL